MIHRFSIREFLEKLLGTSKNADFFFGLIMNLIIGNLIVARYIQDKLNFDPVPVFTSVALLGLILQRRLSSKIVGPIKRLVLSIFVAYLIPVVAMAFGRLTILPFKSLSEAMLFALSVMFFSAMGNIVFVGLWLPFGVINFFLIGKYQRKNN